MFIEPTFSNLMHKALSTKPGTKTETHMSPSLADDGTQVAVYDDQGREMFHHRRLWSVDIPETEATPRRERRNAVV
jgi:hypothetical protein